MKYIAWSYPLVLGALSLGCSKSSEPRSAQDSQPSSGAEVGAEVGGAVDEAAEKTSEAARDVAEGVGLADGLRYRCPTGEEFSVAFRNDGDAAIVERGNRQYWLDLEQGTGRYSSRYGRFWTIDEEVATLELAGEPPLRNCTRR